MEEERGNINRGTTGDATIARALTQHTLWSVNITLLLEMGCLPRREPRHRDFQGTGNNTRPENANKQLPRRGTFAFSVRTSVQDGTRLEHVERAGQKRDANRDNRETTNARCFQRSLAGRRSGPGRQGKVQDVKAKAQSAVWTTVFISVNAAVAMYTQNITPYSDHTEQFVLSGTG